MIWKMMPEKATGLAFLLMRRKALPNTLCRKDQNNGQLKEIMLKAV